jgi:protein-S-isoprenylcysteine O-methyltransferase Ste14
MEIFLIVALLIVAAVAAFYAGWWLFVGLLIVGAIVWNTLRIPDRDEELREVLRSYRE